VLIQPVTIASSNKEMKMKERILKGWTLRRGLYLVIGIFVLVQSVMDRQWFGIFFGAYFTAMGLFGFGCASGNCAGDNCSKERRGRSHDE
jgi:hypothetical protein